MGGSVVDTEKSFCDQVYEGQGVRWYCKILKIWIYISSTHVPYKPQGFQRSKPYNIISSSISSYVVLNLTNIRVINLIIE